MNSEVTPRVGPMVSHHCPPIPQQKILYETLIEKRHMYTIYYYSNSVINLHLFNNIP